MIKFFIVLTLSCVTLLANTHNNFRHCETITLSQLTDIISCDKIDYLIEYKQNDEYKRGEVKKVTAVTPKDAKVIKQ